MLRTSMYLCIIPAVFGIIVKDPPPSPNDYKYSYDIQDPTTGDHKSQHEERQGDIVTGAYTVVGSDGTKRTVEYTADAKNGFKAVVSEEPGHPVPVTNPPFIHHNVASYDVAIPYQTLQPQYSELQPKINYYDTKPIYFTQQSKIEPQEPLRNGHFFLPAHK